MAATVVGFVAVAGVVPLTIASEATSSQQDPSLPLGVAATALFGLTVPLVAVLDGMARRENAPGLAGLRVAGWITYGVAMIDAAALIVLGANSTQPPAGAITGAGLLGASSLALFAADALVVRSQLGSAPPQTSASRLDTPWSFAIAPTRGETGRPALAVGLAKSF
jgi:hypothetical protein